jgi:hypothetical protein
VEIRGMDIVYLGIVLTFFGLSFGMVRFLELLR